MHGDRDPVFAIAGQALEYARKAVALNEENGASSADKAAALDTLAEAYFVNADYDKAIETEKKALALRPDYSSFKQSLDRYQRAKQDKK